MKSIQALIDEKLLLEVTNKKDRIRSGKWSPSNFGKCYRAQWWDRKDENITKLFDLKTIKKMEQGKATHILNQSMLPKEICEVKIETEDVKGFCDIVEDNETNDIKSSEEWMIKRYWKAPIQTIIENKYENFLQVVWYAMELKKEFASIIPCPYGTFMGDLKYTVRVEDWLDDIECELYHLRMYWDFGLPPIGPRCYGGNECTYCKFSINGKCKEE